MASGAFYHCIKRPHWGPDRDTSLSSTDPQPFFGVGNKPDKVDGDLGVKQNNTILDYLYYFLQIMSWKRIWTSKKILNSTNFVGLNLAPTTVFGFRHMTKPWYSLILF